MVGNGACANLRCFPFASILAKIATWVRSVREDMQATDSSCGPVVRD